MFTHQNQFIDMNLIKLNCGLHHGYRKEKDSLDCKKCTNHYEKIRKNPKAYQYDGTPWVAVIGEIIEKK